MADAETGEVNETSAFYGVAFGEGAQRAVHRPDRHSLRGIAFTPEALGICVLACLHIKERRLRSRDSASLSDQLSKMALFLIGRIRFAMTRQIYQRTKPLPITMSKPVREKAPSGAGESQTCSRSRADGRMRLRSLLLRRKPREWLAQSLDSNQIGSFDARFVAKD